MTIVLRSGGLSILRYVPSFLSSPFFLVLWSPSLVSSFWLSLRSLLPAETYEHFLELSDLMRSLGGVSIPMDGLGSSSVGCSHGWRSSREVSFASTAKRNPSSKAEVLPPSLHSLLSSLYHRHERARMPFCPSTLHALTHLAHYVRLFGPPSSYWAFVMERFCGMLKPHLASKVRPTENLTKYVVFLEQIKDLCSLSFALFPFISLISAFVLMSCRSARSATEGQTPNPSDATPSTSSAPPMPTTSTPSLHATISFPLILMTKPLRLPSALLVETHSTSPNRTADCSVRISERSTRTTTSSFAISFPSSLKPTRLSTSSAQTTSSPLVMVLTIEISPKKTRRSSMPGRLHATRRTSWSVLPPFCWLFFFPCLRSIQILTLLLFLSIQPYSTTSWSISTRTTEKRRSRMLL
jgi:hypothetical protein